VLEFHDLRMDLAAHRVFRGEQEVHLSPTSPPAALLPRETGPVFSRNHFSTRLGTRPRHRASDRRRHIAPETRHQHQGPRPPAAHRPRRRQLLDTAHHRGRRAVVRGGRMWGK
jgi:hypothetical protein